MLLFLFLIIDLYIPAAIAQSFSPVAELVTRIGIPSQDAKAEIEIHPVIAEAKIRKCSIKVRVAQTFLCFLFNNSFCYIYSRK